ncbi:hypothetical protein ILUMI_06119 [Ignelater luminosus]|uniref:Uncharacterized protein n=1 Tax=Ignelater luminosus TaxID=2038154 RepID=A0A8K0DBQ7_IGNLU|nr:hypothetical protein ILUMI_06119 [Ignelater luminosus]
MYASYRNYRVGIDEIYTRPKGCRTTSTKRRFGAFFDGIKASVKNFSPMDQHVAKTKIFNIVSAIEGKYVFQGNAPIPPIPPIPQYQTWFSLQPRQHNYQTTSIPLLFPIPRVPLLLI